ncbi:urease accessory protein UreF [Segnochrobactraceae bacterium EtOH-i3]
MTETRALLSAEALARLLAWLSPAFPVGAFTYSHGLEWAIEAGDVTSAASLQDWLADVLRHGAGRSDAIFLAHAHRAASAGDAGALREVADLAAAFQPTRERHLEASAQGAAFLSTVRATWPDARLEALADAAGVEIWTYPVALGLAAGCHGVPLIAAVEGLLAGFAANLVSAAVRAVPLGQTDGQRVIARLAPLTARLAADALAAPLEEAGGGATLAADIASMRHETQYTRLFRS